MQHRDGYGNENHRMRIAGTRSPRRNGTGPQESMSNIIRSLRRNATTMRLSRKTPRSSKGKGRRITRRASVQMTRLSQPTPMCTSDIGRGPAARSRGRSGRHPAVKDYIHRCSYG